MMARYTELNIKKAELKQASGSLEKADLGRYACVTELTRELLVELIKEIRVSGEDALEIVWNFILYQPVAGIHILHLTHPGNFPTSMLSGKTANIYRIC